MMPYGKVAQAAIAAVSLLAEHWSAAGGRRMNSGDIAQQRKLSRTIVAKVLSTLSQTGVVEGSPGPGGGYILSRDPATISLSAVVSPFERLETPLQCPYGKGWCGTGPQCPLHRSLERLQSQTQEFLNCTTMDVFCRAPRRRSGAARPGGAG